MNDFYLRDTCRLCSSHDLDLALPLKASPVCDAYLQQNKKQEFYPLDLYLCNNCGFVQINAVINPEIIYRDYIYVTSGSMGLNHHFRNYVHDVCAYLNLENSKLVIDIGSNDGTLLRFFKEKNHKVLGIEPSVKTAEDATKSGIETLPEFFDLSLCKEIISKYGYADIITINNLFANIDNLEEFVTAINQLLGKDGILIIESSYLLDMINNMVFDFIYHEHLSYFSILPLISFFKKFDMHLINLQQVSTKGGSLRYFWAKENSKWKINPKIKSFIKDEEEAKININTFKNFENQINFIKKSLIDYLKSNSFGKVVGYGASATSTTLISHFQLHDYLNYLVDDNSSKVGTYSPGYHIPVYSPNILDQENPDAILILAWRYKDQILQRLLNMKNINSAVILPLPNFQIINL